MFDHFDKCDICLATIQNDVCVGNAVRMYLPGVKETELEHRRCEWQSGKTLHKQRVVHLNRHVRSGNPFILQALAEGVRV